MSFFVSHRETHFCLIKDDRYRTGDGKTREEKLIVEGCEIKINYAKQDNPEALAAIRVLLEKQRITPKNMQKFDGVEEKCDNNSRDCTLKTE